MIKALSFQLSYNEYSDNLKEYLIEDENIINQLEQTIEAIEKYDPDLIIYPEMSYINKYDNYFLNKSSNKIIIFGSFYDDDNINKTVVFNNNKKFLVPKIYPSPVEPMAQIAPWIEPAEFIKNHLESHTFKLNDSNIYILNCMEYYHVAYYIARDNKLNQNAIIISPCSNSKTELFIDETRAIHNHNENIYSFVINCISKYNNQEYGEGNSYIYGPIQKQNKIWLKENGITSDNHNCSIIRTNKKPCYIYMEFYNGKLSPFGRSDSYRNTPKIIYEELNY